MTSGTDGTTMGAKVQPAVPWDCDLQYGLYGHNPGSYDDTEA